MLQAEYPVIDTTATGKNIARLRKEKGYSVAELQNWFGFESPQAIYKWQRGESLPSVDNLYALSILLEISMNDIIVEMQSNSENGQFGADCPFGFQLLTNKYLEFKICIYVCFFR